MAICLNVIVKNRYKHAFTGGCRLPILVCLSLAEAKEFYRSSFIIINLKRVVNHLYSYMW